MSDIVSAKLQCNIGKVPIFAFLFTYSDMGKRTK